MRSGIILLLLCALAWFGWRLADVTWSDRDMPL